FKNHNAEARLMANHLDCRTIGKTNRKQSAPKYLAAENGDLAPKVFGVNPPSFHPSPSPCLRASVVNLRAFCLRKARALCKKLPFMFLKRNWLWVGVALVFCLSLAGGCKQKSGPEAAPSVIEPKAPPQRVRGSIVETVARVHWLGKKRIGAETNSVK